MVKTAQFDSIRFAFWLRGSVTPSPHQHRANTLEKHPWKQQPNPKVFSTPKNPNPLFQHPQTFADTLPTHHKFPLTPWLHPHKFCLSVSLRGTEWIILGRFLLQINGLLTTLFKFEMAKCQPKNITVTLMQNGSSTWAPDGGEIDIYSQIETWMMIFG